MSGNCNSVVGPSPTDASGCALLETARILPAVRLNSAMTLFAALVSTSKEVGADASRLAKVRALGAFLRTLEPAEIEVAVLYLSGETPQGRSGLGPAVLQPAECRIAGRRAEFVDSGRGRTTRGACRNPRHRLQSGPDPAPPRALRACDECRTAVSDPAAPRRPSPGGARRCHGRGDRRRERGAAGRGATRGHVCRQSGIGCARGARRGTAQLGRFQLAILSPIAPMLAQTANDVEQALELLPW